MKKYLFLLLTSVLLLSCKSEKTYKKEALELQEKILKMSVISEQVCSIYHSVWSNAVYKEGSYLDSGSPYYLKDFNEALFIASEQVAVKESKDSLALWEKELEAKMGEVNDYPENLTDLKNELINAYTTAKQYSRLAKEPTGSLTSFTQEINGLSIKIKESNDKIMILAK